MRGTLDHARREAHNLSMTTRTETASDARWTAAEQLESLAYQLLDLAQSNRAAARFGEGNWSHVGSLNHAIAEATEAVRALR